MLIALESGELAAQTITNQLERLRRNASFTPLAREYRVEYEKIRLTFAHVQFVTPCSICTLPGGSCDPLLRYQHSASTQSCANHTAFTERRNPSLDRLLIAPLRELILHIPTS